MASLAELKFLHDEAGDPVDRSPSPDSLPTVGTDIPYREPPHSQAIVEDPLGFSMCGMAG